MKTQIVYEYKIVMKSQEKKKILKSMRKSLYYHEIAKY